MRIDPAAREGTFVVDVALDRSAAGQRASGFERRRNDRTGTSNDVLYVGRPAFGQGQQTVGMFRLSPDGQEAARTQVTLGRSSVSTIEIVNGLKEGDQVILSDTSAHG